LTELGKNVKLYIL